MQLRKLNRFPPIEQIKQLDQLINAPNAKTSGLLNFEVKSTYRPAITAPFSFFSNTKGEASYRINGQSYSLEENGLLLMNRGSQYDIQIDNPEGTIIQNMHINENLLEHAFTTLTTRNEDLIDNPYTKELFEFTTGIVPKPALLPRVLEQVKNMKHFEETRNSDVMLQIADLIFLSNHAVRKQYDTIKSTRTSVKRELFKRVNEAKDYIWSNYKNDLDLDVLCRVIGMSKFHFLRVFKSCYGITPYQYLTKVRHQKAKILLLHSKKDIQEVAFELGFEVLNSFTKSFRKIEGVSPKNYRLYHK